MRRWLIHLGAVLLLLSAEAASAGTQETKVLESAAEVIAALSDDAGCGIPRSLMRRAAGVAIVPNVRKAGLVIDVRAGRGVVLARMPDGGWSNPVFVSLKGGGVGGQAGIETTDLVLVFKTRKSLDRALRGKLALGGDVSVAAGPVGENAEAAADARLKADIYSYSQSRGLFVGVSLDGTQMRVKTTANRAFYGLQQGTVEEVLAVNGAPIPAVEALRAQLTLLSKPSAPPPAPAPAPLPLPAPPVVAVCSSSPPNFLLLSLSPALRQLDRLLEKVGERNGGPAPISGGHAAGGAGHQSSGHHAAAHHDKP
jgi:lipid-binding SYLF domain-containing protein